MDTPVLGVVVSHQYPCTAEVISRHINCTFSMFNGYNNYKVHCVFSVLRSVHMCKYLGMLAILFGGKRLGNIADIASTQIC